MLASQPAKAGDYGFNYITKGGRIILKDSTMMHEMRQTPSYYNKNEGVSNLTLPLHYQILIIKSSSLIQLKNEIVLTFVV